MNEPKTLVVAHRGDSARFSENTAFAFESAIAAGADYIETDLRLSRDGEIVCCHDPDLKRIAGQTDNIADLDLAAIKAVPFPKDQRLLTLEEVLDIARRRVRVMLDVKIATDALLDRVAALLARTGMAKDVIYGARDSAHLRALKARRLGCAILGMPVKPDWVADFIATGADAIRLWEEDVTGEAVAYIHKAGKTVWVTCGLKEQGEKAGAATAARVASLANRGIDAVLVNDPKTAREAVNEMGATA